VLLVGGAAPALADHFLDGGAGEPPSERVFVGGHTENRTGCDNAGAVEQSQAIQVQGPGACRVFLPEQAP
jgi:hypothetical protein